MDQNKSGAHFHWGFSEQLCKFTSELSLPRPVGNICSTTPIPQGLSIDSGDVHMCALLERACRHRLSTCPGPQRKYGDRKAEDSAGVCRGQSGNLSPTAFEVKRCNQYCAAPKTSHPHNREISCPTGLKKTSSANQKYFCQLWKQRKGSIKEENLAYALLSIV